MVDGVRDIPEEMVEKAAAAYAEFWGHDYAAMQPDTKAYWRRLPNRILSAALAGVDTRDEGHCSKCGQPFSEDVRAVVVDEQAKTDWAVVEAAVARGITEHAAAYAIPANRLAGDDRERERRMAESWGKTMAPFVTACIREDLRKAGDQ